MYQTISETISVAGAYIPGGFKPAKFRWKNRLYPIKEICSQHDFKDGNVKKRRFSVLSGSTVYLLEFNRDQESWQLVEIWLEE